jgi:hypothetical protein
MDIKEPKFPKDYNSSRKPLPSSTPADKIPPKTEIKPFAGLPASTGPRPLKGANER